MLIDGAVLANTPSVRTMSALDPLTGKEKWHHTWAKGTVCQRAVLSGVPYLACLPDVEKPDATEVLRLDPATGSATKVATLPGGQQLMGTTGDRLVLIAARGGGAGAGAGAGAGGKDLRLTTVSGSGERVSRPYRTVGATATSEVIGDRLISVSWQGKASAYSLTTGKTLWTRPVGVELPGQDTMQSLASPVVSAGQGVVYFFSPTGDLSGLDLRTGEVVWRDHVDMGKERPAFGGSPQLLLYEDALIARNGSTIVSLLPRVGG
jgi:outer membrane protein assembly factor BamB